MNDPNAFRRPTVEKSVKWYFPGIECGINMIRDDVRFFKKHWSHAGVATPENIYFFLESLTKGLEYAYGALFALEDDLERLKKKEKDDE